MAGGSGHSNESPERLAMFARRSQLNHEAIVAYAGAVSGLAALFIIFHLLRIIGRKMGFNQKGTKSPSFPVMVSRLLRKAPVLPTMGHVGLVALYLIINIVLTVHPIDTSIMEWVPNLASRTAWLAIGNLVVVVFLALKNTPLAYLTAWSYERINVLHQVAGCLTVVFVILHASFYSAYFVQQGRASRLLYQEEIYGMVAGVSFVGLWFVGTVIRAWWYELFYYLHVTLWMLGIVMVGLHQPELSKKIIFATCVAGGMWVLDRIIRVSRLIIYSSNNSATLTSLPNGGTRVTLKKPPVGAVAGMHCFLWIPRIRSCESHPFTIAALNPLEFVIASYDGFTSDLHRYATANPGVTVKASVEGAYGTFPDPTGCEKLLLIAGGSGATFTFGAALNALQKMGTSERKSIIFVWVVKEHTQIKWFDRHLKTLASDDRVTVMLYVTRTPSTTATGQPQLVDSGASSGTEISATSKALEADNGSTVKKSEAPNVWVDSEKVTQSQDELSDVDIASDTNISVTYQRPDVSVLIRSTVEQTAIDDRLLVMGCGPDGLMNTVRNTTAACIRTDGPAVELHCEQFGW